MYEWCPGQPHHKKPYDGVNFEPKTEPKDTKRGASNALVLLGGHTRKLSEATVLKLDEYDREQRRLAQRQGHSHPIAQSPAITHTGKIVGRVSR
jgi:hypothetical protein